MLCISVAPVSRKLGKVDILNAAGQCDLIELRLDRLEKDPDIADLLSASKKPVLISCRRQADGGSWDGSEDDRLKLLRNAIVAGPAYVELELDIADKVPRFGKTKRVVSYTKLDKPLANLEPIYDKAVAAKADAVKFVGLTPTLDAAWPLLAAVAKKRDIPVVGLGVGRPGVMFSLLGARYGVPWVYAALEKGLEAYDGQATVGELENVYRLKDVGPQTRFVAVTGFGPTEALMVRVLNEGFAQVGLNFRCLPLEIGATEKFVQALDVLHVNVILATPRLAERMLNIATDLEEGARVSQYADLLVKQNNEWRAFNTIWRACLKTLETKLGAKSSEDRPLDRRNVLIMGAGGAGRGVAYGINRRKGLISVTSADDNEAKQVAQMFQARFVPAAQMYDTLCDVVIITEAQSMDESRGGVKLNPSFLRPHMCVADLTNLPRETPLLGEARIRGCHVINPPELFQDHLAMIFKTITGKELPAEALECVDITLQMEKELQA